MGQKGEKIEVNSCDLFPCFRSLALKRTLALYMNCYHYTTLVLTMISAVCHLPRTLCHCVAVKKSRT